MALHIRSSPSRVGCGQWWDAAPQTVVSETRSQLAPSLSPSRYRLRLQRLQSTSAGGTRPQTAPSPQPPRLLNAELIDTEAPQIGGAHLSLRALAYRALPSLKVYTRMRLRSNGAYLSDANPFEWAMCAVRASGGVGGGSRDSLGSVASAMALRPEDTASVTPVDLARFDGSQYGAHRAIIKPSAVLLSSITYYAYPAEWWGPGLLHVTAGVAQRLQTAIVKEWRSAAAASRTAAAARAAALRRMESSKTEPPLQRGADATIAPSVKGRQLTLTYKKPSALIPAGWGVTSSGGAGSGAAAAEFAGRLAAKARVKAEPDRAPTGATSVPVYVAEVGSKRSRAEIADRVAEDTPVSVAKRSRRKNHGESPAASAATIDDVAVLAGATDVLHPAIGSDISASAAATDEEGSAAAVFDAAAMIASDWWADERAAAPGVPEEDVLSGNSCSTTLALLPRLPVLPGWWPGATRYINAGGEDAVLNIEERATTSDGNSAPQPPQPQQPRGGGPAVLSLAGGRALEFLQPLERMRGSQFPLLPPSAVDSKQGGRGGASSTRVAEASLDAGTVMSKSDHTAAPRGRSTVSLSSSASSSLSSSAGAGHSKPVAARQPLCTTRLRQEEWDATAEWTRRVVHWQQALLSAWGTLLLRNTQPLPLRKEGAGDRSGCFVLRFAPHEATGNVILVACRRWLSQHRIAAGLDATLSATAEDDDGLFAVAFRSSRALRMRLAERGIAFSTPLDAALAAHDCGPVVDAAPAAELMALLADEAAVAGLQRAGIQVNAATRMRAVQATEAARQSLLSAAASAAAPGLAGYASSESQLSCAPASVKPHGASIGSGGGSSLRGTPASAGSLLLFSGTAAASSLVQCLLDAVSPIAPVAVAPLAAALPTAAAVDSATPATASQAYPRASVGPRSALPRVPLSLLATPEAGTNDLVRSLLGTAASSAGNVDLPQILSRASFMHGAMRQLTLSARRIGRASSQSASAAAAANPPATTAAGSVGSGGFELDVGGGPILPGVVEEVASLVLMQAERTSLPLVTAPLTASVAFGACASGRKKGARRSSSANATATAAAATPSANATTTAGAAATPSAGAGEGGGGGDGAVLHRSNDIQAAAHAEVMTPPNSVAGSSIAALLDSHAATAQAALGAVEHEPDAPMPSMPGVRAPEQTLRILAGLLSRAAESATAVPPAAASARAPASRRGAAQALAAGTRT